MKPRIWLRIAAGLQALGTVLHTMATTFRGNQGPAQDAVFAAMQTFHFQIMGVSRTHWDFYRGYELSITVSFGVIAILLWQLGSLSRTEPRHAAQLIVTILAAELLWSVIGWDYFFAGPGGMSLLIAGCLCVALLTMRRAEQPALTTHRAVNPS
jgi:hypothetical protein